MAAGPNINIDTLKTLLLALVRQQYKDKYPHFKFAEVPDYEAMARDWLG